MQSFSQIVTSNKPAFNILQAGCPAVRPTNNVKALKGNGMITRYGMVYRD